MEKIQSSTADDNTRSSSLCTESAQENRRTSASPSSSSLSPSSSSRLSPEEFAERVADAAVRAIPLWSFSSSPPSSASSSFSTFSGRNSASFSSSSASSSFSSSLSSTLGRSRREESRLNLPRSQVPTYSSDFLHLRREQRRRDKHLRWLAKFRRCCWIPQDDDGDGCLITQRNRLPDGRGDFFFFSSSSSRRRPSSLQREGKGRLSSSSSVCPTSFALTSSSAFPSSSSSSSSSSQGSRDERKDGGEMEKNRRQEDEEEEEKEEEEGRGRSEAGGRPRKSDDGDEKEKDRGRLDTQREEKKKKEVPVENLEAVGKSKDGRSSAQEIESIKIPVGGEEEGRDQERRKKRKRENAEAIAVTTVSDKDGATDVNSKTTENNLLASPQSDKTGGVLDRKEGESSPSIETEITSSCIPLLQQPPSSSLLKHPSPPPTATGQPGSLSSFISPSHPGGLSLSETTSVTKTPSSSSSSISSPCSLSSPGNESATLLSPNEPSSFSTPQPSDLSSSFPRSSSPPLIFPSSSSSSLSPSPSTAEHQAASLSLSDISKASSQSPNLSSSPPVFSSDGRQEESLRSSSITSAPSPCSISMLEEARRVSFASYSSLLARELGGDEEASSSEGQQGNRSYRRRQLQSGSMASSSHRVVMTAWRLPASLSTTEDPSAATGGVINRSVEGNDLGSLPGRGRGEGGGEEDHRILSSLSLLSPLITQTTAFFTTTSAAIPTVRGEGERGGAMRLSPHNAGQAGRSEDREGSSAAGVRTPEGGRRRENLTHLHGPTGEREEEEDRRDNGGTTSLGGMNPSHIRRDVETHEVREESPEGEEEQERESHSRSPSSHTRTPNEEGEEERRNERRGVLSDHRQPALPSSSIITLRFVRPGTSSSLHATPLTRHGERDFFLSSSRSGEGNSGDPSWTVVRDSSTLLASSRAADHREGEGEEGDREREGEGGDREREGEGGDRERAGRSEGGVRTPVPSLRLLDTLLSSSFSSALDGGERSASAEDRRRSDLALRQSELLLLLGLQEFRRYGTSSSQGSRLSTSGQTPRSGEGRERETRAPPRLLHYRRLGETLARLSIAAAEAAAQGLTPGERGEGGETRRRRRRTPARESEEFLSLFPASSTIFLRGNRSYSGPHTVPSIGDGDRPVGEQDVDEGQEEEEEDEDLREGELREGDGARQNSTNSTGRRRRNLLLGRDRDSPRSLSGRREEEEEEENRSIQDRERRGRRGGEGLGCRRRDLDEEEELSRRGRRSGLSSRGNNEKFEGQDSLHLFRRVERALGEVKRKTLEVDLTNRDFLLLSLQVAFHRFSFPLPEDFDGLRCLPFTRREDGEDSQKRMKEGREDTREDSAVERLRLRGERGKGTGEGEDRREEGEEGREQEIGVVSDGNKVKRRKVVFTLQSSRSIQPQRNPGVSTAVVSSSPFLTVPSVGTTPRRQSPSLSSSSSSSLFSSSSSSSSSLRSTSSHDLRRPPISSSTSSLAWPFLTRGSEDTHRPRKNPFSSSSSFSSSLQKDTLDSSSLGGSNRGKQEGEETRREKEEVGRSSSDSSSSSSSSTLVAPSQRCLHCHHKALECFCRRFIPRRVLLAKDEPTLALVLLLLLEASPSGSLTIAQVDALLFLPRGVIRCGSRPAAERRGFSRGAKSSSSLHSSSSFLSPSSPTLVASKKHSTFSPTFQGHQTGRDEGNMTKRKNEKSGVLATCNRGGEELHHDYTTVGSQVEEELPSSTLHSRDHSSSSSSSSSACSSSSFSFCTTSSSSSFSPLSRRLLSSLQSRLAGFLPRRAQRDRQREDVSAVDRQAQVAREEETKEERKASTNGLQRRRSLETSLTKSQDERNLSASRSPEDDRPTREGSVLRTKHVRSPFPRDGSVDSSEEEEKEKKADVSPQKACLQTEEEMKEKMFSSLLETHFRAIPDEEISHAAATIVSLSSRQSYLPLPVGCCFQAGFVGLSEDRVLLTCIDREGLREKLEQYFGISLSSYLDVCLEEKETKKETEEEEEEEEEEKTKKRDLETVKEVIKEPREGEKATRDSKSSSISRTQVRRRRDGKDEEEEKRRRRQEGKSDEKEKIRRGTSRLGNEDRQRAEEEGEGDAHRRVGARKQERCEKKEESRKEKDAREGKSEESLRLVFPRFLRCLWGGQSQEEGEERREISKALSRQATPSLEKGLDSGEDSEEEKRRRRRGAGEKKRRREEEEEENEETKELLLRKVSRPQQEDALQTSPTHGNVSRLFCSSSFFSFFPRSSSEKNRGELLQQEEQEAKKERKRERDEEEDGELIKGVSPPWISREVRISSIGEWSREGEETKRRKIDENSFLSQRTASLSSLLSSSWLFISSSLSPFLMKVPASLSIPSIPSSLDFLHGSSIFKNFLSSSPSILVRGGSASILSFIDVVRSVYRDEHRSMKSLFASSFSHWISSLLANNGENVDCLLGRHHRTIDVDQDEKYDRENGLRKKTPYHSKSLLPFSSLSSPSRCRSPSSLTEENRRLPSSSCFSETLRDRENSTDERERRRKRPPEIETEEEEEEEEEKKSSKQAIVSSSFPQPALVVVDRERMTYSDIPRYLGGREARRQGVEGGLTARSMKHADRLTHISSVPSSSCSSSSSSSLPPRRGTEGLSSLNTLSIQAEESASIASPRCLRNQTLIRPHRGSSSSSGQTIPRDNALHRERTLLTCEGHSSFSSSSSSSSSSLASRCVNETRATSSSSSRRERLFSFLSSSISPSFSRSVVESFTQSLREQPGDGRTEGEGADERSSGRDNGREEEVEEGRQRREEGIDDEVPAQEEEEEEEVEDQTSPFSRESAREGSGNEEEREEEEQQQQEEESSGGSLHRLQSFLAALREESSEGRRNDGVAARREERRSEDFDHRNTRDWGTTGDHNRFQHPRHRRRRTRRGREVRLPRYNRLQRRQRGEEDGGSDEDSEDDGAVLMRRGRRRLVSSSSIGGSSGSEEEEDATGGVAGVGASHQSGSERTSEDDEEEETSPWEIRGGREERRRRRRDRRRASFPWYDEGLIQDNEEDDSVYMTEESTEEEEEDSSTEDIIEEEEGDEEEEEDVDGEDY